jgi:RES domain-containing protein
MATGEGARLYGGRWNSRGVRVVYASTSLSLAVVETFVNLAPNLLPTDLMSVEVQTPEDLEIATLALDDLPAEWHKTRDESLRHFGDEWIRRGKTAGLLVPSAVIRGEWNVLFNPAHRDFAKVSFGEPEIFAFDARMFR